MPHAGFGLLIKLWKIFPQNSKSFPEVQGNYLFFKEFSRALEENYKIPGVVSTMYNQPLKLPQEYSKTKLCPPDYTRFQLNHTSQNRNWNISAEFGLAVKFHSVL